MTPFTLNAISMRSLFFELFNAGTENDVEKVINKHPEIFNQSANWKPLGGSETTYGVM